MGVCVNILGIGLLEDRECAAARREAQQGTSFWSRLFGNNATNVRTRQDGRTDRTEARQDGRTDRTELRTARDQVLAEAGIDPTLNPVFRDFFGTVGNVLGPPPVAVPQSALSPVTAGLLATVIVGGAYVATRST